MKILSIPILFLVLFPFSISAANPLEVVINEVAWMGTTVSYNDEWIELYNNTTSTINLDGWVLKAIDGNPEINLTGTISTNSFFLLERTDDNTIPGVPADKIYKGALDNNGETLELYDNYGNLIDSLSCSSGWFAGDNSTKQTMERKNPQLSGSDSSNWQTSQNPGGTPKTQNSIIVQTPLENDSLTGQVESQPQTEPPESVVEVKPQQPIIYPTGVVINEVLPSPEGPDEEEEWIEIFNQNDFEIDLTGWQIQDITGKTKTYTFSKEAKIAPQGFLVLPRPESKITLNNEGDSLNLIQPDEKIIDSVTYEKAPRGQSYNKSETGWVWSNALTPGSPNVTSPPTSSGFVEPAQKEKVESVSQIETKKKLAKEELAAISEQIPKENLPILPFLIAFSVSIFFGILILFFKKGVEKLRKID